MHQGYLSSMISCAVAEAAAAAATKDSLQMQCRFDFWIQNFECGTHPPVFSNPWYSADAHERWVPALVSSKCLQTPPAHEEQVGLSYHWADRSPAWCHLLKASVMEGVKPSPLCNDLQPRQCYWDGQDTWDNRRTGPAIPSPVPQSQPEAPTSSKPSATPRLPCWKESPCPIPEPSLH